MVVRSGDSPLAELLATVYGAAGVWLAAGGAPEGSVAKEEDGMVNQRSLLFVLVSTV